MLVIFRGDPAGVFRAVFDKSVAAESSEASSELNAGGVQKWTQRWKE